MKVVGNCLKYLKSGWNRKEGREHKDFKKRGQPGSRGGCLKKGSGWNPLRNYADISSFFKKGKLVLVTAYVIDIGYYAVWKKDTVDFL